MSFADARVSKVKSASLTDALGRMFEHRAHVLDLVSPTPGRVLFGPAVTIAYLPVRKDIFDAERHSFARLFYEAVEDAPAGKVLVLSSAGHHDISLGGGTKLSRLQNHGMAGLLCDGRIRDFDELRRYDFACYCSGTTTRWGGDVLMPFAARVPVSLGGVTILPGDFVYADEAAAVVIPSARLDAVLDEAVRIEADDAKYLKQIRGEDPAAIRRAGSQER